MKMLEVKSWSGSMFFIALEKIISIREEPGDPTRCRIYVQGGGDSSDELFVDEGINTVRARYEMAL